MRNIAAAIFLIVFFLPGLAAGIDPAFEKGWREPSLLSQACYYDSRMMENVCVSQNDRCFKYDSEGEYEKQIKACTRDIGSEEIKFSVPIGHNVADRYYNRGNAYYELGEYGRAMSDYSKAIELNKISYAYNNRGLLYYMKGDYDSAISDYSNGVQVFPGTYRTRPFINRGDAYFMKGDYRKAITDYTTAITLEPSSFLANYLGSTQGRDEAKVDSDYRKAIGAAYYKRGLAYRRIGNMDKAESDQKEAIAILRNQKQLPGLDSRDE